MAPSIYQRSPVPGDRLCQGEILSSVIRVRLDPSKIGDAPPSIIQVEYSYAIILTQACDLAQDFIKRQRQEPHLPDVLFCQLPTAAELMATLSGNTRIWDRIKINKDERYHFLQKIPAERDLHGEGLPELGVDFKHYFTIPTDEVYRRIELGPTRRRAVLCTPYLEHLSSRFAYFMSRVGLPTDHVSE